jgi:hypothetical protein
VEPLLSYAILATNLAVYGFGVYLVCNLSSLTPADCRPAHPAAPA